jgi:hypothetical protein
MLVIRNRPHRVAVSAALFWLGACATAAGQDQAPPGAQRPEIVVADGACNCPSVAGTFVALFDPERGMLLLSGAPFPGGFEVVTATGAAVTVALPGTRTWTLDGAESAATSGRLWAARYSTRFGDRRGCVGFDKHRFSAEGDLFSYARWLIEMIYLELPAEERDRWPGFRLSDRQVRLQIERQGFAPFHLSGKEGATLAARYPDSERILLFMPFVLDAATGRVAVKVGFSDRPYWEEGEKTSLGFVIASPNEPAWLGEPPLAIAVVGIEETETGSSP